MIPDETNQSESFTLRLRKTPSFSSSDESSPSDNRASSSSPAPKLRGSPDPKITLPDDRPSSSDRRSEDVTKPKKTKKKRLLIQGVQEVFPMTPPDSNSSNDAESPNEDSSADVAFIIQVFNKFCFTFFIYYSSPSLKLNWDSVHL